MTALTKRSTVYLDPVVHRALRMKSIETAQSLSQLVNEALRGELAADADDLAAFAQRRHEPTMTFERLVKKLRADGTL